MVGKTVWFQFMQLGATERKTARVLGITESVAVQMFSNQRIKVKSDITQAK